MATGTNGEKPPRPKKRSLNLTTDEKKKKAAKAKKARKSKE